MGFSVRSIKRLGILVSIAYCLSDSAVLASSSDYFYQSTMPVDGPIHRVQIAYVPAGMIIPVSLDRSISTAVAEAGEPVQATVKQEIQLGRGSIPAGSIVLGNITTAEAGRRLGRSGELGIKFCKLRLPDGTETPIDAHIDGGIGKYAGGSKEAEDTVRGETLKNKIGSVAFRGAIGAGSGAVLGTAVGAIAGGGRGAGRGAWSGTAIGTGLGAADSLLLRKGNDVLIKSGTQLRLQLDSPANIAI
jgi:hypothetical protein